MQRNNQFVFNAPVPPDRFIGRKHEIDQILSRLANRARISTAISGDPRVGKTSLLHYLCSPRISESWGLSPAKYHFLYLDCHNIVPFSEEAFWRFTLRELGQQLREDGNLRRHVQRSLEQPSPDIYDLNSLFDQIARAGHLVVLILDEFEGVVENLNQDVPELLYHLRALLNRPERGLALLVASRNPLKQLCANLRFAGSPFDNSFAAMSLLPFREAEVDDLVDQYQAGFSLAERSHLRQMAGTHPFLVQLTASLIVRAQRNQAAGETIVAQIEADLERETEDYFSDILKYSSQRERMLLTWLALSQLNQQISIGLSDLLARYDQEIDRQKARGLVVNQSNGPAIFSPVFSRWVLRKVLIAGGREVLSHWRLDYANIISNTQKVNLENLTDQVIRRPAIIKNPGLLDLLPNPIEVDPGSEVDNDRRLGGRYIIEKPIGQGSLTDIFRGYDPHLDRPVAIKRLRTTLSDNAESRARFEREARTVAVLRHPNILQIYELNIEHSRPYMVMEFIEGHNLKERLYDLQATGQTLPWAEILRISARVADALDYAHQRHMIHRDVKPANILLGDNGGVFLADFGLVRLLNQPGLTQSGQLLGSLAYLAPEQIRGESKRLDYRADIYSLGCVVYEMVTGRPPFMATELPRALIEKAPPLPSQFAPDLPEAANQVILQALAKDPADRPRSVAQFIADLQRVLKTTRQPIQLSGTPLPSAGQKAVIKQLYIESSQPRIARIHIIQRFRGGLSGAQVILAQPIDERGRGLANEVIKIGPATMLRREYNRYRQFVKGRLPATAVTLEHGPVELGNLACLSYGFVGDRPLGTVVDLEDYYATHSGGAVIETLTKLMEPLDARWYGQSEPLLATYADEYSQQLPAHLRLQADHITSDEGFDLDGYQPIDIETILAVGKQLRIGQQIAIRRLRVSQVLHEVVKLQSDGDGPKIWIRAMINTPRPDLQEGDRVSVLGTIEARRDDILATAISNALSVWPDITRLSDDTLRLQGLDHLYSNPLTSYPRFLKRQLNGRRSIIHGDLHPGNILVDESGRGWLIDFDHVREGHVLFDFIKLETVLRLFVLGGVRRLMNKASAASTSPTGSKKWPYAFTLAEYAAFEAALVMATVNQPAKPIHNAELAKAAEVILAIRHLARPYLRSANNWDEYLTGLFLHNVAQLRFYENQPQLGVLPLTTAAIIGREISR